MPIFKEGRNMPMSIQSSSRRDTRDLSWKDRWLAYLLPVIDNSAARRADGSTATEAQEHFVLTAFVLGVLSIVAAVFPICGLPIAVSGLVMALAGRRIASLHTLATWSLALSLAGLTLTLINIIISISIYLTSYLWA
jgi:hypothetical protein